MFKRIIFSVKSFFSNARAELKSQAPEVFDFNRFWKGFLLFTAGSALLIQFLTYASVFFNTTEARPIVATVDDDTQEAIRLTLNTYLMNDNGARAYGPIYYRVASVARFFGANPFYNFDLSPEEQLERSAHFSMLIVNLLSIFVYSFILAMLVHPFLHVRLILTFGLVNLFLQNDLRTIISYIGKPDHLAVVFMSFAFLLTWKWLSDFENKNKILKTTFAWAVAASTKLSVLFFAPGFIVFWFYREWTSAKWTFIYFVKWILLFYFLVGFPQNFDVPSYIGYLIHQNSYTSLVTWDFFTQKWLVLFYQDLRRPFLFLLVAVPFFHWSLESLPSKGQTFSATWNQERKTTDYLRIILFALIAFVVTTYKKTTAPFEWYTFPLTNILLIIFILVYQRLLSWIFPRLLGFFKSILFFHRQGFWQKLITSPNTRYFVLLVSVTSVSGGYSKIFYSQHKNLQSCRPEARAFKHEVDTRAATGAMILADSTAPYDHKYHDKNIFMTYEMKTSGLTKFNPKYLALKKSYYSVYMPRSEGGAELTLTHITNIDDTRNFYRTYFNKTEGTDVFGHSWKLIYTNACTFELWERQ